MQSIREVFRKNGLSEDATDILMKSWSFDTSKQYSPHILRLCDFCSNWNSNPFNASLTDGAEFLTQYFLRSECKYSVINHLSANPTKWSNTLKQFVGNFPTNCLSVFEHFVGLPLKELILQGLRYHQFFLLNMC